MAATPDVSAADAVPDGLKFTSTVEKTGRRWQLGQDFPTCNERKFVRGRRGPGRGVQRRAGHEMACVAAGMFSGPGGGAGRPDWTATEALSAAWLPPKDPASISLRRLLFLLRRRSLLLLSAPSIALQFLLSFPSCVSSLPSFISLPPLLLLAWAITDTQQRAESWGWVAAAVGRGD